MNGMIFFLATGLYVMLIRSCSKLTSTCKEYGIFKARGMHSRPILRSSWVFQLHPTSLYGKKIPYFKILGFLTKCVWSQRLFRDMTHIYDLTINLTCIHQHTRFQVKDFISLLFNSNHIHLNSSDMLNCIDSIFFDFLK